MALFPAPSGQYSLLCKRGMSKDQAQQRSRRMKTNDHWLAENEIIGSIKELGSSGRSDDGQLHRSYGFNSARVSRAYYLLSSGQIQPKLQGRNTLNWKTEPMLRKGSRMKHFNYLDT